jgi:CRISPR-associated protein Cas1
VYDLEEPFRWIADVAVMEAFESQVLDLPDFYFTGDDYRYRIESEAKQRFIDHIRERFNSSANNRGRILKWDTVIEQKTRELGQYLIHRSQLYYSPNQLYYNSNESYVRSDCFHDLMSRFQHCLI